MNPSLSRRAPRHPPSPLSSHRPVTRVAAYLRFRAVLPWVHLYGRAWTYFIGAGLGRRAGLAQGALALPPGLLVIEGGGEDEFLDRHLTAEELVGRPPDDPYPESGSRAGNGGG